MWKDILSSWSATLVSEMKDDLVRRRKPRLGIENTMWKRIPAITYFKHIPLKYNKILAEFGITKRMIPKGNEDKTFKPLETNEEMNHYMEFQVKRLRSLRTRDPAKFWNIAHNLALHSVSFRVSAVNRVFKYWYKDLKLSTVISLNRKASKIIREYREELDYRRVYIPKDNGKVRPLGVPTPEWRLVLHMYACFMHIFLEMDIPKSQHAYQPRKGCLTAWIDLVPKLDRFKYIYEIDLKGCFDNIQLDYVVELLKCKGVPKRLLYWIENINLSVPKFPKEKEMDEAILEAKAKTQLALGFGNIPLSDSKIVQSSVDDYGIRFSKGVYTQRLLEPGSSLTKGFESLSHDEQQDVFTLAVESGCTSIEEYIQLQWALTGSMPFENVSTYHKGLAQGSNMSPLLTIFALSKFSTQGEDSVFYADDGIFFSNSPLEIMDDPKVGITIHPDKSKYVKYNGEWISELKFLGLTYNPDTKLIRGSTRKGSTLEFTSRIKDLIEGFINLEIEGKGTMTNMELLCKTQLVGWVQSRLYDNTWENVEHEWDVTWWGREGSLLYKMKLRDNFSTTSSLVCSELAGILSRKRFMYGS